MPGMYHSLRNVLERRPLDSLEHGQKVALLKAELAQKLEGKNAVAAVVAELKQKKFDLEKEQKTVNLHLTASTKLLADYMEEGSEESFKRTEGGSYFLEDKIYPYVYDKDAYRKWLIDNGYERQMTVHHSVTESIVGERALKNLPLPDGVKVFIDVGVGVRGVVDRK